ncbi:hypothetical protein Syun_021993 [Stephania yunnanensis]|uniref:Uncharacterized protein n=1 Tax=Stephania yunnanensis TaxID=152371 RepID=A0AAP0NSS0_9MAGN
MECCVCLHGFEAEKEVRGLDRKHFFHREVLERQQHVTPLDILAHKAIPVRLGIQTCTDLDGRLEKWLNGDKGRRGRYQTEQRRSRRGCAAVDLVSTVDCDGDGGVRSTFFMRQGGSGGSGGSDSSGGCGGSGGAVVVAGWCSDISGPRTAERDAATLVMQQMKLVMQQVQRG